MVAGPWSVGKAFKRRLEQLQSQRRRVIFFTVGLFCAFAGSRTLGSKVVLLCVLNRLSAAILHVEELAIRVTVNLHLPRPVPPYAAHAAWPSSLCCPLQIPWPRCDCSLLVREAPTGSCYLLLAITPSAWPCLYLAVQQEALTCLSFV